MRPWSCLSNEDTSEASEEFNESATVCTPERITHLFLFNAGLHGLKLKA